MRCNASIASVRVLNSYKGPAKSTKALRIPIPMLGYSACAFSKYLMRMPWVKPSTVLILSSIEFLRGANKGWS